MPKATKNSACGENSFSKADEMVPSNQEMFSSPEHEPDAKVSFYLFRPPLPVPIMFISYIEGSKIDWTVNDGLYHTFLKWYLNCKNSLECELAALPE